MVPRFSVFVWVSAGGRPCAAAVVVVVRCSGDLRPARAEAIVALSVVQHKISSSSTVARQRLLDFGNPMVASLSLG